MAAARLVAMHVFTQTVSRVATAALVAATGNKQWVRMIPVKQRNAAHATSSHPGRYPPNSTSPPAGWSLNSSATLPRADDGSSGFW